MPGVRFFMSAVYGCRAAFGQRPREGPWMQRFRSEHGKGIHPER